MTFTKALNALNKHSENWDDVFIDTPRLASTFSFIWCDNGVLQFVGQILMEDMSGNDWRINGETLK